MEICAHLFVLERYINFNQIFSKNESFQSVYSNDFAISIYIMMKQNY
jgi:hypothetical protein